MSDGVVLPGTQTCGSGNGISVAVITLNEADRLTACLASAALVSDDIVVVDAGSTDGTLEIAARLGARVSSREWQGFGSQKQFAVDQCRNPWVFILDADETIPPETADELNNISLDSTPCKAFRVSRKNYFLGRWIRHAGWWPDLTVRLFHRHHGHIPPKVVHEAVEVDGEVGCLKNPIIHQPFRTIGQMMVKMDHYSTAGAATLYQAGKRCSLLKAFFRSLWTLFYNFLLRGGFLDGGPGLIIAVSDAMNIFFKYAKLHELQHRQPPPPNHEPQVE